LAAFSSYVLALAKNSYKKRARKTLMKSTQGVSFTKICARLFLREQDEKHLLANGICGTAHRFGRWRTDSENFEEILA